MYKKATQLKLRFISPVGSLSVEQLWDLKMNQLTLMIKNLKQELNKNRSIIDEELSFLEDGNVQEESLDKLRFDILKDIFLQKKAENDIIRQRKENEEFNRKLDNLIMIKKDKQLEEKSLEELLAMRKNVS